MGEQVDQISTEEFEFPDGVAPPAEVLTFKFEPLAVTAPPEFREVVEKPKGPAHYVAIRHPSPVGMQERRLEYRPGLSAKHYLREARLIGMRMRLSLRDGKNHRVRLNYVPSEFETLSLVSR